MPAASGVGVAILAGGHSRRMGQDKAALVLNGETLLARTVRLAQTVGPVAVVTPWPERYRATVPSPCTWLPEAVGGQGPLAGLQVALAWGNFAWLLALACDLPYLQADTLRAWSAQLPAVPVAAIALLPVGPKGWEPLCGFYRPASLPNLVAYRVAGGRSLQGWLQQQQVAELAPGDRRVLFNCNTPADWARVVGGALER